MIKNFNCNDKKKLEYLEKYTDDVFDNISKNLWLKLASTGVLK